VDLRGGVPRVNGVGDVISVLLTGDPVVAPGFQTNGGGIRDLSPNRIYPDDVTGEPHGDGLIFAGAVWDLWGIFAETMDDEAAFELISTLFVDAIKSGPTVPDSYDEFIGEFPNWLKPETGVIKAVLHMN
jgi:hypothetical protein